MRDLSIIVSVSDAWHHLSSHVAVSAFAQGQTSGGVGVHKTGKSIVGHLQAIKSSRANEHIVRLQVAVIGVQLLMKVPASKGTSECDNAMKSKEQAAESAVDQRQSAQRKEP